MINMVEPREAEDLSSDSGNASIQDNELTTLVRRWMAVGSTVQDRVRRESMLSAARESIEPASVATALVERERAESSRVVTELLGMTSVDGPDVDGPDVDGPDVDSSEVDEAEVEEASVSETLYVVATPPLQAVAAPDDLIELSPQVDVPSQEPQSPQGYPPLPQRSTASESEQVHRVALLIDARRVSADVATGLLQRLGERGSVNVCRAYGDWNRSDLGDWVGQLRREGLHSFHHFAEDDDQALVAMTVDAVDIARDAAVDEVVIAGDLTSALPLVHRLHAAGVRVVAVGSAHTPHDVRAACHEFIDTSTLNGTPVAPAGRHRA